MSMENEVHDLWVKACEFDHVDPKSKFIVFSDENPYAKAYDQVFTAWAKSMTKGDPIQ